MLKRYLVVDQNFLRKPDLKAIAESEPNARFVLPDVALTEMCKSPQWESTLRGSLSILSAYPNRTRASISVGEAINSEINTQRSIAGHLLPREFIPIFNELLSALSAGTPSKTLAQIAHRISSIQASLAASELNHEQNKLSAEALIKVTKSIVTDEQVKSLRNGSMKRDERLGFIFREAPFVLEDFFHQANFSKGKARRFLKTKPLILRYTYLKMWASLDWIAKGGFEGLPPERATNEAMDHDYVLLATFFEGILSKESKVNEAYQDLCQLLRR